MVDVGKDTQQLSVHVFYCGGKRLREVVTYFFCDQQMIENSQD